MAWRGVQGVASMAWHRGAEQGRARHGRRGRAYGRGGLREATRPACESAMPTYIRYIGAVSRADHLRHVERAGRVGRCRTRRDVIVLDLRLLLFLLDHLLLYLLGLRLPASSRNRRARAWRLHGLWLLRLRILLIRELHARRRNQWWQWRQRCCSCRLPQACRLLRQVRLRLRRLQRPRSELLLAGPCLPIVVVGNRR